MDLHGMASGGSFELPRVPDNRFEVVVVLYHGTNILIVLFKLHERHLPIVGDGVKIAEEFIENVILRSLSCEVLGVLCGAERFLQILDVDHPVTGHIKFTVSLQNHRLPSRVQTASNHTQKFSILHAARAVHVEYVEQYSAIFFGVHHPRRQHALREFFDRQTAISHLAVAAFKKCLQVSKRRPAPLPHTVPQSINDKLCTLLDIHHCRKPLAGPGRPAFS
mmetsp:Transcript_23873/g.57876  ORF Transcript_23873/g.57876 Transcript_23873/m.57876 type:complete len:221 (+) Transcript_23873:252-914(+)